MIKIINLCVRTPVNIQGVPKRFIRFQKIIFIVKFLSDYKSVQIIKDNNISNYYTLSFCYNVYFSSGVR